jgi:hypothetical protein
MTGIDRSRERDLSLLAGMRHRSSTFLVVSPLNQGLCQLHLISHNPQGLILLSHHTRPLRAGHSLTGTVTLMALRGERLGRKHATRPPRRDTSTGRSILIARLQQLVMLARLEGDEGSCVAGAAGHGEIAPVHRAALVSRLQYPGMCDDTLECSRIPAVAALATNVRSCVGGRSQASR